MLEQFEHHRLRASPAHERKLRRPVAGVCMRLTAVHQLPTYRLYAEDKGLWRSDVMHVESIAERSSLHSWEIKPHRHEALFQFFHVQSGRAEVLLDGRQHQLKGPGAITVMPLAAHGFRWTSDVRGTVFTMQESHLHRLFATDVALREVLMRTRIASLTPAGQRGVRRAVLELTKEYHDDSPWRSSAINASINRLAIALGRALPADQSAQIDAGERAIAQVQRFRLMVDERFRAQPSLTVLAAEMGITTTQLNRLCRSVLGHSALGVLHARTCLEAQRELAYTTLSIKQIAYNLGFTDAAYFSRFFARHTGTTPSAWRTESGRP